MQLIQLQEEKELIQIRFQLLLNSEAKLTPAYENPKLVFDQLVDSTQVYNHPNIKILEQKKNVSIATTKLEKSKLLPNLTLGYNNTTMIGMGANDVLYDESYRFQSVQFGIGIPLFGGSQNAKINATKISEALAETDLAKEKQILQNQFKSSLIAYESNLKKMHYYEETALPNAEIIIKTANLQFYNGEINYLDWVMLQNQSIAIKNNYIDTLLAYNESIIQLNYLTSKQ